MKKSLGEHLRKFIERIGYFTTIVLFIIAIILAILYSKLVDTNFFVGILAMILAVFGSYYLFISFEAEEKPLELEPGEKRNLKTVDIGVVIFPKKVGGIRSKDMHKNLSI